MPAPVLSRSMRPSSSPPRHRLPRVTRACASAWLVVYALVAAALPLADARADHDGIVVMHVEDGTGSDCPTPHDASLCHTCQVLTSPVETDADAPCPAAVLRRETPVATFEPEFGRLTQRGKPAPRAPPHA